MAATDGAEGVLPADVLARAQALYQAAQVAQQMALSARATFDAYLEGYFAGIGHDARAEKIDLKVETGRWTLAGEGGEA